ncbi:MAG: hypothetical protein MJ170_01345 [Alphaproteobacteria bacterium]|nr:hypothetical protein [Alphaproteobacteria bacterium]
MKKIVCSIFAISAVLLGGNVNAATATAKKQSAIQNGTSVRTKVAAVGIYDQACYDAYYGCMDQFCITDNTDGGSCACSDDFTKYEQRLANLQTTLENVERISTEEVERIQAGANADIIFNGTRVYGDDGNVVDSTEVSEQDKKTKFLEMWNKPVEDEDDNDDFAEQDLSNKIGSELFSGAHDLCVEYIDSGCAKDMKFLRQIYSRQITADCKALDNSIAKKESEAKKTLLAAESAIRSALKESLDSANKYDRGQCMVEYKKCMQTADACGKNWENCVFEVAFENAQQSSKPKDASAKELYTVPTGKTYDISTSTMSILESKRYICENVLNSCVAVRDMVWNDFLREAAPTIRLAESQAESKKRQSCLSDISNCIQKACKDDIAGKGVATMDACLARPDMAYSFCKVEIEPCLAMEPQIWSYVTDKLAAMRVDACTTEVKECFTDETRCGSDFSKCIGMDYDYIHDICPIDKLVVCKQANPKFSMNDLDSMLMGLYLNIDNSMLDNCQNLVDQKMTEVCGSTTDCNKFAADDVIGTGSLRSQKIGDLYRVTGMISFGSIKMGDASGSVMDTNGKLAPGQIGVSDYIANVRATNTRTGDEDIVASIEEELNNIAGTINRTIEMIEQDPEIQYCVNGRNLSQITGKNESTAARFPNLLNSVKMQIAVSALRQAQDNYNKKFTDMVAQATKDASADIAQYMCQMMPMNNGGVSYLGDVKTELVPPYSISYDVGTGLTTDMLTQGGHGSSATSGAGGIESKRADRGTNGDSTAAGVIASVGTLGVSYLTDSISKGLVELLGNNNVSIQTPSGSREMWSVFDRDNRICHYCTSTITKSCSSIHKNGFLGIGQKDEQNCTESEPVEKCEDIQM